MNLPAKSDPRPVSDMVFRYRRKLRRSQLSILYSIFKNNSELNSRLILIKIEREIGKLPISIRHLNRIRCEMGFAIKKGRPEGKKEKSDEKKYEYLDVKPNFLFMGMAYLDDWIEKNNSLAMIINSLMEGINTYSEQNPDKNFPLLNHSKQTMLRLFKALLYAPLFGIKKLSEYDVKEHGLLSVIGQSYQSSTLNQYLGQLEWVNASDMLISTLIPLEPGLIGYIDGHMTPYWSSQKMHKGKITMLGRIMAGSQAVVMHNESGKALFFDYYPPDIHLSTVILDYCERVVQATGIKTFVIDRAVNSLKIAQEFEGKQMGLISMLDSNQYKSLSDWETQEISETEDKAKIYKGTWSENKEEDPRIFVIVEEKDRLLVYWGTPAVESIIDPKDWPELYSSRTEIQENSFKGMKAHGALDVNYGTKTIEVADRHHERKVKALKEKYDKAVVKTVKKKSELLEQEKKVKESIEKDHKALLSKRKANHTGKKKSFWWP